MKDIRIKFIPPGYTNTLKVLDVCVSKLLENRLRDVAWRWISPIISAACAKEPTTISQSGAISMRLNRKSDQHNHTILSYLITKFAIYGINDFYFPSSDLKDPSSVAASRTTPNLMIV